MIKSMTGFGKAVCNIGNKKIAVEIKSLNSKNSNLSVKIPELYNEKELEIRNLINRKLLRGKINVTITTENELSESYKINEDVVSNYYEQINGIVKSLGHDAEKEQIFRIIFKMPGVYAGSADAVDTDEWKMVLDTVDEAIIQIDDFRKQEGEALEKDILSNVLSIKNLISKIEPFELQRIETIKTRLQHKIDDFFSKQEQDKNRFEQEIIYYLEKLDINEEKIRLHNHCDYFMETVKKENAAGKKLAFISQEMGREINTLGSKANHPEIQKVVVIMKDYLEKIKEQLLNIL